MMANFIRDGKENYFMSLSRGERVRLMMEHSYEIQESLMRDSGIRYRKARKAQQQENVAALIHGDSYSLLEKHRSDLIRHSELELQEKEAT